MKTNNWTILCVDDVPENLYAYEILLGKLESVNILTARSGGMALKMLLREKIDLILLDIQMPGMDGYEVASLLRGNQSTAHIPVIFITAVFKQEEFVAKGFKLGAVDYLTKPLDDNLLLNRLRLYLNLFAQKQNAQKNLQISRTIANQLKEEKEKLRLFIEHVPAAVAMFDLNMNYLAASHRWLFDYNIQTQNIIGKSHYDIFAQITQECKEIHRRALFGEVIEKDEDMFQRADGNLQWLRWKVRPWNRVDGGIGGIIIFSEDITERKAIEKKLKEQENMIIVQSRQAAMGEMISMIAHQWRQPLNVVSMAANNILMDIQLEELNANNMRVEINEINKQTQYMSKTIDDFKNFFKSSKTVEKENATNILRDVLSIIHQTLKANNIEITIDCNPSIMIETYKSELTQVLINILSNAKDALKHTKGRRRIMVALKESNDNITFSISNNGPQIPENILDTIFEPYFTTKESSGGTGLGLYMSQSIIQKHMHGTIIVKNSDDGVAFIITIPKLLQKNLDT